MIIVMIRNIYILYWLHVIESHCCNSDHKRDRMFIHMIAFVCQCVELATMMNIFLLRHLEAKGCVCVCSNCVKIFFVYENTYSFCIERMALLRDRWLHIVFFVHLPVLMLWSMSLSLSLSVLQLLWLPLLELYDSRHNTSCGSDIETYK